MASANPAPFNVVCPKCHVQYPVDVRAISGVKVKCKRCGEVFTAMPLPAGARVSDNITRTLPSFHAGHVAKAAEAPPAAKPGPQPSSGSGPGGSAPPGAGPGKSKP